MDTRQLAELTVGAIGLGCMGLSQGYGATEHAVARRVLRTAIDEGVTIFDTAMSYGAGANERLVGDAIRGHEGVRVATKFGLVRSDAGVSIDARPARIRGDCEASLVRLGVDVIDLYYLHRADPNVPIEDSVGAMAALVDAGLVRELGVSEVTVEQLERAVSVHPIAALQLEWSLMWREPERELIPAARRLGVGIVPYSPLGRGLLTATLSEEGVAGSDFRRSDPRFGGDALRRNQQQVAALRRFAADLGLTSGQLALAWLLAQGPDVVPIPGTRNPDRVVENCAAASVVVEPEVWSRLAGIVPAQGWAGDRRSFGAPVTTRSGD